LCFIVTFFLTPKVTTFSSISHLYTRPIEIAREAGFRMPKLEILEAELQFLEETLVLIPTSD